MTQQNIQRAFRNVIKASVPIAAFETADPAACIKQCCNAMNGKADELTFLNWDCITSLTGLNKPGADYCAKIPQDVQMGLANPAEVLRYVRDSAPKDTVLFYHNAQRFLSDATVMQAVWNIRDAWKGLPATLVLLGPAVILPPELKHDAVIITEPLPGKDELRSIIDKVLRDAELPKDKHGDLEKATDTVRGLSAFAAEQALAMSLSKAGIDMDGLWQRKRKLIEQTPGLAVWTGGESFDDLGGLGNLKTFLTRVLTSGNTPVRAIGFIDEIEKGLAGAAGDTSGTSQDQLQVFLKVMQDLNIPGMILLGHPGTGKSAIAKAAGRVADCPVVAIDTGAMKGSLVGESEAKIRAAMEVFKAVSDGQGLFIATCNKIASLPPELRRRFTLGTFFVDLPSADEQARIWDIWKARYDIKGALPPCADWTGAEIRACCDVAFRTGLSLVEASQYVVPIIKSAPAQVEELRKLADGRYLDASKPGVFSLAKSMGTGARKLNLE